MILKAVAVINLWSLTIFSLFEASKSSSHDSPCRPTIITTKTKTARPPPLPLRPSKFMILQAALTCLLYERDQAQARVAELEEQLAEARDTIRDGFAEVEASRADSNRNGKASLDAETRPSSVVPDTMRSDVKTENNLRSLRTRRRGAGGGELGAVGPVRGAAPRPHALLMADNASVDLGDRSLTDGVEDECFENCRVSPLSGLDLRVGDADDVSATVNHRGSKGGIVRDENAILLRPGQAETRLEGLKAPIPEKEEEAGTQVSANTKRNTAKRNKRI